jgi:hypothetical protein
MFTKDDIYKVAANLQVEPAAVAAVIAVEASSRAFNPPGSITPQGLDVSGWPIIRFEAHVFYRELKDVGIDPIPLLSKYPTILSKVRNDKLAKGPVKDYDRLLIARALNLEAANKSASWGAFQILGTNHLFAGFQTVAAFVEAMKTSEGQLTAFEHFIRTYNVKLLPCLQKHIWTTFARIYNGPGYALNGYHTKLHNEYIKAQRKYK